MSITRFDRWGLLKYIVEEAEKKDIKVGHTFVQKFIYLLQEGMNVPLGHTYKLHHYGPYSEFLWGELTSLKDYGFLKIQPEPEGFGYNVSRGDETTWLDSRTKDIPKEKVKKLLEILNRKSARELELLATSHFIYKDLKKSGQVDENQVVKLVIGLKPHFNKNQVKRALILLKGNGLL